MSAHPAICRAAGCVEVAPEYIAFGPYTPHDWRYHLCPEHMRPIRVAALALIRAPAEIVPPSPPARQSPELAPTR